MFGSIHCDKTDCVWCSISCSKLNTFLCSLRVSFDQASPPVVINQESWPISSIVMTSFSSDFSWRLTGLSYSRNVIFDPGTYWSIISKIHVWCLVRQPPLRRRSFKRDVSLPSSMCVWTEVVKLFSLEGVNGLSLTTIQWSHNTCLGDIGDSEWLLVKVWTSSRVVPTGPRASPSLSNLLASCIRCCQL